MLPALKSTDMLLNLIHLSQADVYVAAFTERPQNNAFNQLLKQKHDHHDATDPKKTIQTEFNVN